jgi:L-fuconolactonase
MTSAVRVDAHHHVWDLSVRDQPWTSGLPALQRSFAMAELAPSLDLAGIDSTIVVQTVGGSEETPELLRLAHDCDLVAGVVGWVDLTGPDVAQELAALTTLPGGEHLVGIRHQVQEEPDPAWLTRPDVLRGLGAVAAAGLAYDLVVTPGQLPAVLGAVAAVPDLRFVLDHAGKPAMDEPPTALWVAALRGLSAADNVAVKLSGLATQLQPPRWETTAIRPYADTVLDLFGPRRTMFGSDWPVCLLAGDYDEAVRSTRGLCSRLNASEQGDVFGGAATRWYGLAA